MPYREVCIIEDDASKNTIPDSGYAVQIKGNGIISTESVGSALVITSTGTGKIQGDSGPAIAPVQNLIHIVGGTQIQTVGSGNTLTINCSAPVMTDFATFVPKISGSILVGSATYSVHSGFYTKINGLVFVSGSMTWTGHTGTGNMEIANLPFIVRNLSEFCVRVENIKWPTGNGYVFGEFQAGTTIANILESRDNQSMQNVQVSASGTLNFSGLYLT